MHAKMQVFLNQPRCQISALLILLFGRKKKLCLERMPPGEKSAFLHKLFVENERETSKLK